MRLRHLASVLTVLALAAGSAAGQGLIVPVEPDLPPLALQSHRVTVEIEDQGATTTIEQVFLNHTDRQLEAQYVFPVPSGAVVSRFTMMVNGREKTGELVEKGQARQIYNSIVNQARDPGLLECLGRDLFRANIFPILPHDKQTITIRFTQVLPSASGLVAYEYPVLSSAGRGPNVQGTFSIDVTIRSRIALGNVYSPTHPVLVARSGDREARVGFEAENATLDKDFQLFYGHASSDVGLNLVAHRTDPSQPGYFMLLVSPRSELQAERIVARDVVFVVDTSGSMNGPKIEQLRRALRYCVEHLDDGDRFNIVEFNTEVEAWKNDLVGALEGKKAALAYIDTIVAQGGTNIAGALDEALRFSRDPSRPYFVIFMTDGKPTLGETTDAKKILAKLDGVDDVRIFSWGVGYDLDTHLVDALAERTGGASEYVRPEEDIAARVAAFYEKTSHPVLTDLALDLAGDEVQLVNVYPKELPDLYAGGQLVLIGRYTGRGSIAVKLSGEVNGESEAFTYECDFPDRQEGTGFIEPLWARRRIGHLLEAIRLHGESKELVDDVIRLSKEYGIQTPYTSWLVLEDGMQVPPGPTGRPEAGLSGGRGAFALRDLDERRARELERKLEEVAPPETEADRPAEGANARQERADHNELAQSLEQGFAGKDGKAAVDTAGYLKLLKESDQVGQGGGVAPFQRASGVRFFAYRGMWVDERFEAAHEVVTVKFGSKAYFRILELHPELVDSLKLGTSVVRVTAGGKALVVSASEGEEDLADDRIEALFR